MWGSEVAARNYMSIGEILVTLKTEFPDITISKIRFLEGEGLIDPERTASGYRKFHQEDVDLLRMILRLQKDLFKFGVEPRHLSMYKHFAEREATFFESIVLPTLRQKNPEARRTAAQNLTDLAALSRKLKQALLRANLRQYLQGA